MLRWLWDGLLVVSRIGKVFRRAKHLERQGMSVAAFDEAAFAFEMLRSPWLDYWNPVACSYRFKVALALARLAPLAGRPMPEEQLEEELEALKAFQKFSGYDGMFKDEIGMLEQCLAKKSPSL
jgi:hypothetical protein